MPFLGLVCGLVVPGCGKSFTLMDFFRRHPPNLLNHFVHLWRPFFSSENEEFPHADNVETMFKDGIEIESKEVGTSLVQSGAWNLKRSMEL